MKTLKLKKEVVSILNSDESSKIRGGAGTSLPCISNPCIENTKITCVSCICETAQCTQDDTCVCLVTKDCEVTNDGCKISDAEDCPLRTIINCEG